jgi:hypothetical protein
MYDAAQTVALADWLVESDPEEYDDPGLRILWVEAEQTSPRPHAGLRRHETQTSPQTIGEDDPCVTKLYRP